MTLDEAFDKFDRENPHVYELFKRFAFELIGAGYKVVGAELIIQRIRWETAIKTQGDRFKINNNHRSRYARKFMRDFPQYEGLFRTRRIAGE